VGAPLAGWAVSMLLATGMAVSRWRLSARCCYGAASVATGGDETAAVDYTSLAAEPPR